MLEDFLPFIKTGRQAPTARLLISQRPWRHSLRSLCVFFSTTLLLCCLSILPSRSNTPEFDPHIGADEIAVAGTVESSVKEKDSFLLRVSWVTSPDGKSIHLPEARLKTILTTSYTQICFPASDQEAQQEAQNVLQKGALVTVIGKDLGQGKSLPARVMAVWHAGSLGADGRTITTRVGEMAQQWDIATGRAGAGPGVPEEKQAAGGGPAVEKGPGAAGTAQEQAPDKYDYSTIDTYAMNTPDNYTDSIPRLAAYLVGPARNDREKARAIYDWLSTRIAYDIDGVVSGRWQQQPEAVLQIRCTDCVGYARLFRSLAQAAGLDTMVVSGLLRSLLPNPAMARFSKGPHYITHSWNMIKIEGEWHFVDVTSAGTSEKKNGQSTTTRTFNPYFFLTPPGQAIYTHYPDDPQWQLLAQPLSLEEQDRLPYLHDSFFRFGMAMESHKSGTIQAGGRLSITLSAPPDCVLLAQLQQGSQKLEGPFTFVQTEGLKRQIYAVFPQAGEYNLQIWVRHQGETIYRDVALEYQVRAAAGGQAGFPKTYDTFYDHNCYLYTPMAGDLRAGTTQLFQIRIPGALSAGVNSGGVTIPLRKQEDTSVFAGYVRLEQGEVTVTANFPFKPETNWGLVQYRVQ